MREEARERASSLIYTGMECLPVCTRNTHTHTPKQTHIDSAVWVLLSCIYIYTPYTMYSGHRYVQLCVQASGQLIRQLKSHQIAQATTNGLKQKTRRKRNNLKTEVESTQSNVPAAPEKTLASPSSYNVHFHVARTVDGKKLLCCLHNGCKIMKIPTILNKQAGLSHADSGWYFLLPRPFFEFKHPPVALTCKCHALSTYFNHRKQRKKQQE